MEDSPGFSLLELFFRAFLARELSNYLTAVLIVWRQSSCSAVMVDHWWGSMWQDLSALLRQSLHRFFGAPLSR